MTQRNLEMSRALARHSEHLFDLTAGNLKNEFHCAGRSCRHHIGIHSTLEAVAGIAQKTQGPRGASNRRRIENSAFKKDLGGGGTDPTPLTSHDAGKGDGAVLIGNHKRASGEVEFTSIQRVETFALRGAANANRARYFRGIESVEGLTQLEKNVVRHVHDVVHRAQSDRSQAVREPLRAGADLHSCDATERVVSTSRILQQNASLRRGC